MVDHQHNRPPAAFSGYLDHARFRAARSPSGIGAAAFRSSYDAGGHRWQCVVSDGTSHHYLTVLAPGLGPRPNISQLRIEEALERFAEQLPADRRLEALSGRGILRMDGAGEISG